MLKYVIWFLFERLWQQWRQKSKRAANERENEQSCLVKVKKELYWAKYTQKMRHCQTIWNGFWYMFSVHIPLLLYRDRRRHIMTLQTLLLFFSLHTKTFIEEKTNQTANGKCGTKFFGKDYINTYLWATFFTLIPQIDFFRVYLPFSVCVFCCSFLHFRILS